VYVFPLPDKAAVDYMRLYIGDRFIEAEIREKDQARKVYEQAKQAGKKTSLVEQQRANLFTTSVANIAPGETVIVEIEYLEDLQYDEGTFSLRFPMTLTPRYIPGQALADRQGSGWSPDTSLVDDASLISPPMVSASGGHRISLRASVNAGVPLEIIASRYHPVNVVEADGYVRHHAQLARRTQNLGVHALGQLAHQRLLAPHPFHQLGFAQGTVALVHVQLSVLSQHRRGFLRQRACE